MHFERMFASERPRVDDNVGRLGKLRMSARRHRRLAQRRAPLRRWMNGNTGKRDAVGGADDDDPARRLRLARPRSERRRGDRARISQASVRRDDDLWRDAAIRPSPFADILYQAVQRIGRRRVKQARDLRRMDRLGIAQRR